MALNIENKRQFLIIAIAILFGVLATIGVAQYVTKSIEEETARLAYQFEEKQKIIDKRNREQMAALNQQLEQVRRENREAIQKATDALKKQQELLEKKKEEEKKPKPSLALRTPSGKRALTVQMPSLGAVGGLINPGDFVDVIADLSVPKTPEELDSPNATDTGSVTVMVFQNLQILAIDTNLEDMGMYDDQQKVATLKITFAVDPQEAGLMSFASRNGKLELALRSPREKTRRMTQASTWETLAEYILENQGTEITVPVKEEEPEAEEEAEEEVEEEDLEPTFRIFRGGREL